MSGKRPLLLDRDDDDDDGDDGDEDDDEIKSPPMNTMARKLNGMKCLAIYYGWEFIFKPITYGWESKSA